MLAPGERLISNAGWVCPCKARPKEAKRKAKRRTLIRTLPE
jgi:hypothetical protein